jgi:hypothetical protein
VKHYGRPKLICLPIAPYACELQMLKVYIDDSNVGVEPVSVLAGWAADEETWVSFEKEWSAALGMSPRLAYFKETEANGRSGEFAGWSEQSFADRMHLLMRIMADHKPFGLISAVPTKLYYEVFGKNPDKVLAYPYFFMINDLVSRMGFWLERTGYIGKVQFIFDEQKGQEEAVSASWPRLLRSAPPNVRPLLTDYPIFRSDKTTMALQAADFSAGHLRRDLIESMDGKERPDAPWIAKMNEIVLLGKLWNEEKLFELSQAAPCLSRELR